MMRRPDDSLPMEKTPGTAPSTGIPNPIQPDPPKPPIFNPANEEKGRKPGGLGS